MKNTRKICFSLFIVFFLSIFCSFFWNIRWMNFNIFFWVVTSISHLRMADQLKTASATPFNTFISIGLMWIWAYKFGRKSPFECWLTKCTAPKQCMNQKRFMRLWVCKTSLCAIEVSECVATQWFIQRPLLFKMCIKTDKFESSQIADWAFPCGAINVTKKNDHNGKLCSWHSNESVKD